MTLSQRIKLDLSLPVGGIAILIFIYLLSYALQGDEISPRVDLLYSVGLWFGLSWWLWEDSRRNKYPLPMNYGLLMLILTPIFAPVYLFQSRGWMAFITLGLYGLIFAVSVLFYIAVYYLAQ